VVDIALLPVELDRGFTILQVFDRDLVGQHTLTWRKTLGPGDPGPRRSVNGRLSLRGEMKSESPWPLSALN
jgi:hypothetical protein